MAASEGNTVVVKQTTIRHKIWLFGNDPVPDIADSTITSPKKKALFFV